MNILFLTRDYPPNLVGGVGSYVYEISRLLTKIGHRVFVLTGTNDIPCDYEDNGVQIISIKPKEFNFLNPVRRKIKGFLDRLEYSYAVSQKLKNIIKRYKIDIVESCEARAEGFWFYLFQHFPPLVVKLHTPESIVFKLDNVPLSVDYLLIKYLEEWWIRKAKKIIGLSKSVVSLSGNFFKLHSDNFPIVPNPIDINIFKPAGNIKNDVIPTVIYVGRLEFRKGAHVLIRAIPFILNEIPEVKFLFIGDDCGMGQYLSKKVIEFGLEEKVIFIPRISRNRLIKHYQQSTICAVPSLWENHPYVILETMACGKPLVATEVGGVPEIIQHRKDGILVPPGSPMCLANGIIELLKNKDLREEIGRNARKKMEERYSPYFVAKKTLEIYTDVLDKRSN